MTLVKWTPRTNLLNEFDTMFQHLFDHESSLSRTSRWNPSIDIEENETAFILSADIPGLSKKDVSIEILDGVLTLKGERNEVKNNENDYYVFRERNTGSFCRSFKLPDNVEDENIKASFKNGVLTLTLPKMEVIEPEARTIKIN